ncbi:hypothetical protein ES695_18115 [Candidatus Atribacteria bacterium 1244-E10-H5-B2]|nr:MAG: hypothetical protein ES695_18115 [Candidatus Atribacteria bacterium 1244-E10-H5-B2]
MSKIEITAIIILIITVVCLIVLPRWYYHTHSTASTINIINAIYIATAVEIILLGGLIISFRK